MLLGYYETLSRFSSGLVIYAIFMGEQWLARRTQQQMEYGRCQSVNLRGLHGV
jgi:hypothetical protein